MFEVLLISNSPEEIRIWDEAGVNYTFVDLEYLGKEKRQGHLDTVFSKHTTQDITSVRPYVRQGKLLVRINPLNQHSKAEIDEVIERGADVIMLPMFYSEKEVSAVVDMIAGRCELYPLIETPEALKRIEQLSSLSEVSGYHIGLNDLHLASGTRFMFEIVLQPNFEYAVEVLRDRNIPFGFGGVARLGGGVLSAELILSEHKRLGSSKVILSRQFKLEVKPKDAYVEVERLKDFYKNLSAEQCEENRFSFINRVKKIASS
jgi:hypothetical protein